MLKTTGFGQRVIETSLGSMVYYTQWLHRGRFLVWKIYPVNLPPQLWRLPLTSGPRFTRFCHQLPRVSPDLIGWGESGPGLQIADYDDIGRVYPTNLSLSSGGGGVFPAALSIRLAIQQPDLFQALFLVCPAGFDDFGQVLGADSLQVISTPLLDRLIYALGENEIAVRNFLEQFLLKSERVSQEMVEAYLASAQQPNAEYAALAFCGRPLL